MSDELDAYSDGGPDDETTNGPASITLTGLSVELLKTDLIGPFEMLRSIFCWAVEVLKRRSIFLIRAHRDRLISIYKLQKSFCNRSVKLPFISFSEHGADQLYVVDTKRSERN